MTRRRTSVIAAPRAAQAAPAEVQPQALRDWAMAAIRELLLSAAGDAQQEQVQLQATRRRWRIAQGRDRGNPAPSNGRSKVTRLDPDADGKVYWSKVFDADNVRWQSNETNVLKFLGEVDPHSHEGLRRHVGWLKQYSAQASRLAEVQTLDAGPNLDMWLDFGPCAGVGAAGLPLPLFVQPMFLAALSRQSLIALDALARHEVVHTDLKPGNLCLALPEGFAGRKGLAQGRWDLRQLPLRMIDFEVGCAPGIERAHHGGDNANASPFVRACYQAAAQASNPFDRAEHLSGIDWGADLWSLGLMLGEWCQQAQQYMMAYLDAFGARWGVGSAAHLAADHTVMPLLPQLGRLRQFAAKLQAYDRGAASAQQRRLTARADRPHRALWGELEEQFRQLGPSAGDSTCAFALIDPEAPLAEEAGPGAMAQAWLDAQQHAAALWAASAARARGASGAVVRQRGRLLAAALVAGLPALAWAWRGELHEGALALSSSMAAGQLRVYQDDGQAYQRRVGQAWLALADALQAGRAAELTLRVLAEVPGFDDRSPVADAATLAALRDRALRALTELADLPDAALAELPAMAQGQRLLLVAYHSGAGLERQAGTAVAPGAGNAAAPEVLAHVHATQGWPLAALLHVHQRACYGAPARQAELTPYVQALLTLPPATASRASYVAFAQSVRQRLASGQNPCLLNTGAAAG